MHTSTGKVTATGEGLQLGDANPDGPHDILGQAMDLLRHESAKGAGGDACVSLVHALTAVASCANEVRRTQFGTQVPPWVIFLFRRKTHNRLLSYPQALNLNSPMIGIATPRP
jgi:hypothetical protein